MTFPFDLTDGFKQSADSPDLSVTTDATKEREHTAFNLGMGDGIALEASGMMARSNGGIAKLNNLQSRKEKDKRFEDLIYNQMLKSLNAIGAEMDWLEDKIHTEEKAIQQNNTEIDFIRTLNEDNIMGADGKLHSDVQALLKKYGKNNLDDKDPDEIMHMLETIETNLHGDNIERERRIDGYQKRHGTLREHSKHIAKSATGAAKEQAQKMVAREPSEVKTRLALDAHTVENEDLAEVAETQEAEQNFSAESSEFGFKNMAP